ncbi:histone-lysine N-methyltransferase SETMAR [Trichonephila clavipes]|nr:histone-lysine N-methyltransferase SETMAR [Trichonephila clavipes]
MVNAQDTDAPLDRGRPRSSRWIQKKWPGFLRSGILLLDDNVRPHSEMALQNLFATLGCEHIYYPTYGPDLAPSDFHLFSALK